MKKKEMCFCGGKKAEMKFFTKRDYYAFVSETDEENFLRLVPEMEEFVNIIKKEPVYYVHKFAAFKAGGMANTMYVLTTTYHDFVIKTCGLTYKWKIAISVNGEELFTVSNAEKIITL